MALRPVTRVTSSACLYSKRSFSSTRNWQSLKLAYRLHPAPDNSPKDENHRPIIFMHGLFGSKRNNGTVSTLLAKDLKRDIYAIDLRNHGDSPHDPRHDYPSMAEDVQHFIAGHGLEKPALIGHSMGAKVAMTLALKQPSLISALIPVDNSPIDAALKSDFSKYIEGMLDVEASKPTNSKAADKVLSKYESNLGIRHFLLANIVRHRDGRPWTFGIPLKTLAKAIQEGHMADFPYKDPGVTRYEGPTLLIRGTKSHYVPDDFLPAIGQFFPRFELLDIDCGHWVISEEMEQFRAGVREWFEKLEEM